MTDGKIILTVTASIPNGVSDDDIQAYERDISTLVMVIMQDKFAEKFKTDLAEVAKSFELSVEYKGDG